MHDTLLTGRHNRSWIDLEYDGKTTDLAQAIGEACPGISGNKANDVVQWRGADPKARSSPLR